MTIEHLDTQGELFPSSRLTARDLHVLGRSTTGRSRRDTDYRLRGLDLEAQGRIQTAPKVSKNRHPSVRRHRRRRAIQAVIVIVMAGLVAAVLHHSVIQPFSV